MWISDGLSYPKYSQLLEVAKYESLNSRVRRTYIALQHHHVDKGEHGRHYTGNVWIIVRAAQLIDYADRYAFDASRALFMNVLSEKTKDKHKKRSHKGRGLAKCRRRKVFAMIAVELGATG